MSILGEVVSLLKLVQDLRLQVKVVHIVNFSVCVLVQRPHIVAIFIVAIVCILIKIAMDVVVRIVDLIRDVGDLSGGCLVMNVRLLMLDAAGLVLQSVQRAVLNQDAICVINRVPFGAPIKPHHLFGGANMSIGPVSPKNNVRQLLFIIIALRRCLQSWLIDNSLGTSV